MVSSKKRKSGANLRLVIYKEYIEWYFYEKREKYIKKMQKDNILKIAKTGKNLFISYQDESMDKPETIVYFLNTEVEATDVTKILKEILGKDKIKDVWI